MERLLLLIMPLLAITMGAVLLALALRAVSKGVIAPFRMQRWTEPEPIEREDSPARFWFWVVIYLGTAGSMFITAVLGFMGKIPLHR